eukprot:TRINITY_DN58149_c0_g1_i1.p1 TRINITY_DN58149_c0_g1~~TRINITY_DN58149_c0_g1_i1.p1  ORF type:complete len:360 (-),score=59.61 TRINITY_DN58149_c0_g1_i1:355-1407(-)
MAAMASVDTMILPSARKVLTRQSVLDLRRRKAVAMDAMDTKEEPLMKLSALHLVHKTAPLSCVKRSSETEPHLRRRPLTSFRGTADGLVPEQQVVFAGSAGSALRRMLSTQELSKSDSSKQPLRRSRSTSFARATLEPLAASPSKRKSLTRSGSEVSASSLHFPKSVDQLFASPSKRKPLAHSSSDASHKSWAVLRSSLKRVQDTPKTPARREVVASDSDCNSSKLDARKIGLSRLMYKYARRHHEERSSFQARSEGTADRHPGLILREAMTDIRLAVRTVGHLNRFLELLEERQQENVKSRSFSSASTCMRSDSKVSTCSGQSVETDIGSADDAWNNLLSALETDSDED